MDKVLQDEQAKRVKQISHTIRQTIRDTLPGPADQFLTLMIPGKVVDFEPFSEGFDKDGKLKDPLPSHAVQLLEASLCDDMPSLGPLQLGPTGRSVARSYAASIAKLCPAGSTTGISDGIPSDKLSASEKRYQYAMKWLTFRDPDHQNKTRVDVYREKQAEFTKVFERKAEAYDDALTRASRDSLNTDTKKQREAYDKWVEKNHKTYSALVQAAYMDWVTMGKKEEVEYYFSIVDNDSAMSRVEASKECMRASVISDSDGSSEYHRVRLEPQHWAWLAKNKAAAGPKGETVESLTFDISRLEKINFLLETMKNNAGLVSISQAPEDPAQPAAGTTGRDFLEAQQEFDVASAAHARASKGGNPAGAENLPDLQSAANKLAEKREALHKYFEEMDRQNVNKLSSEARKEQSKLFTENDIRLNAQIEENRKEINKLNSRRQVLEKSGSSSGGNIAGSVQEEYADRAGIPRAPVPPPTAGADKTNYWTSIMVDVSSSYTHESHETTATSATVEASVRTGFFTRASVKVSHQESHSAASKEMANASMKISFECMRVDITRPWLRGELFYDHELRVPEGDFISPGNKLAALIDRSHDDYDKITAEQRTEEMDRYDLFPMYPTAFLLAANVVLEIHGETSSIQSHLNSSSTSGNASLSYGPFAIGGGGSAAHSKDGGSSTCKSTAAGCRITLESPQIIGWISQIVPELPRPKQRFVPDDD